MRYIIVGGGTTGICLIKADNDGGELWIRRFDGKEAWGVQQSKDGGYIVAGTASSGSGIIGLDVLVIKTDAEGKIGTYVTPQVTTSSSYIIPSLPSFPTVFNVLEITIDRNNDYVVMRIRLSSDVPKTSSILSYEFYIDVDKDGGSDLKVYDYISDKIEEVWIYNHRTGEFLKVPEIIHKIDGPVVEFQIPSKLLSNTKTFYWYAMVTREEGYREIHGSIKLMEHEYWFSFP